jgi:hypothetical protein
MQFLLVEVTTLVGVLCLRIAVFIYLSARTQQPIGKDAFAGMLVERFVVARLECSGGRPVCR